MSEVVGNKKFNCFNFKTILKSSPLSFVKVVNVKFQHLNAA